MSDWRLCTDELTYGSILDLNAGALALSFDAGASFGCGVWEPALLVPLLASNGAGSFDVSVC